MCRTRLTRARGALSLALLASGAATLSGCSGSGPAAASSATATSATTAAVAAATAPAATLAASAATAGYVLSTPSTVSGWNLTTPTSNTQQQMQQGLSQAEAVVGGQLSGTPVLGLYDDSADQVWIAFVGLNGSGFDPGKLATAARALPRTETDDLGDQMTVSWVTNVSGGPHGGQTDCQQALAKQAGLNPDDLAMVAMGSACFWMTSTTYGAVSIYPQAGSLNVPIEGYNGQQMDGFMLKVRAAVEQPR
jgi:hypothetical protein